MNRIDFTRQFADRVNNRMTIRERLVNGSYDCIFYDTGQKGCSIYVVRPAQCRQFPFWDEYKDKTDAVRQECPGIKPAVDGE